jgi:hypothetical protein
MDTKNIEEWFVVPSSSEDELEESDSDTII